MFGHGSSVFAVGRQRETVETAWYRCNRAGSTVAGAFLRGFLSTDFHELPRIDKKTRIKKAMDGNGR